jgi:hypothetical protein
MAKPKLPPAHAFSERDISDWNCTTFSSYLHHLHNETYGLPYQSFGGGIAAEKKLMKAALDKVGPEDLKEIITRSFKSHKLNPKYPYLSFGFINTYLKPTHHAQILFERQAKEKADVFKSKVKKITDTDLKDWI